MFTLTACIHNSAECDPNSEWQPIKSDKPKGFCVSAWLNTKTKEVKFGHEMPH